MFPYFPEIVYILKIDVGKKRVMYSWHHMFLSQDSSDADPCKLNLCLLFQALEIAKRFCHAFLLANQFASDSICQTQQKY